MNRKGIAAILVLALGLGFYALEFITGHSKLFDVCVPPRKTACQGEDLSYRSFANADLSGANFSGASLYEVDFSFADMTGADLSEVHTSNSYFKGANLTGANLTGANLYQKNLEGAILRNANLKDADLYEADLTGADLTGADLTGADLSGAVFSKTIWIDGTVRNGVVPLTSPVAGTPKVKKAVSLSCMDGYSLNYCKVRWSDGSGSLITPYGLRQGGVVDTLIYYDTYWDESCIVLYADGSISASYDMSKCY
jgi:hypothetical protein